MHENILILEFNPTDCQWHRFLFALISPDYNAEVFSSWLSTAFIFFPCANWFDVLFVTYEGRGGGIGLVEILKRRLLQMGCYISEELQVANGLVAQA